MHGGMYISPKDTEIPLTQDFACRISDLQLRMFVSL